MNNAIFPLLVVLIVGLAACTSDELPEPTAPSACDLIEATYDATVKTIIDNSCAYSGCHDGSGIGPGDYSTFNGLSAIIQSNSFKTRVIDLKDNAVSGMPPDQSVYQQSQKDNLTDEELEIIECWIAAGYPEN